MRQRTPEELRMIELSDSDGIDKAITDIVASTGCTLKAAYNQIEVEYLDLYNGKPFRYNSYDYWRKNRGRRHKERMRRKRAL